MDLWFGIAQIAYGGIGFLSCNVDPAEALTLLTTGIGTIGLRLKTTKPIESIT